MRELVKRAALMGVRVHVAHLEQGVMGEWYASEREVYVDLRLSPIEQRCTLAHELGHAYHGHHLCEERSGAEDQADTFAAQLLIDPDLYASLERAGLSHHDIAEEIGVTEELLHVFMQRCLTKVDGVTYVHARMGARQWEHRINVA